MLSLELHLLGRVDVRLDGKTIALRGRKECALLTFLAMSPGRPHSRGELAAMLWGTSDMKQAYDSLRQTILRLRKSFGPALRHLLLADRETLMLNGAAATVDVQEFERLARDGTSSALAEAAVLYRDDLAKGLDGLDQVFDEWLLNERQRLHDLARQVLSKLLDAHLSARAQGSAAVVARRLVALDPIDESAHRALMRIYSAQGQPALALKQFELCRQALRREIGEEPEAETEQVYRAIRQSRVITRRTLVHRDLSPGRGQQSGRRRIELELSSIAAVSIALAPFAAMGGEAARDYIASGLTSDLADKLSRLRGLRVASYRAPPLGDKSGEGELGADFVLNGRVQSLGSELSIIADLTDVHTGKVVWREKFDGRLDELFAFQNEIVAVVAAITATKPNIRDEMERSVDLECWALRSRAWREIFSFTPGGLTRGVDLASQLLAQYPRLPDAYNALCYAKFHLVTMGFWPKERESLRDILHLAKQQLKLQPDSMSSLGMLAMVLIDCEAQPVDALALLHRAVEIDPGHPCAYGQMGDASIMAGRPDEGLRLEKFAVDLDPEAMGNYFRYAAMAAASFEKNDLEGAYSWAQHSLSLKSDYVVTHALTAASLALSGDLLGARHAVARAKRYLPGISLQSASELSLFRNEWSEPFQSGLAAAGIR